MNILITGSSGFCGSFIKTYFNENTHHKIFTLSRKEGNGNHIVHDLANLIPNSLIPQKIDGVIHCASIVDEKSSDYSILEKNLKIGYSIKNFVQLKKPKFLINLSSVSVYGNPNLLNIDESFPQKPISIYGLSKFLVEQLFHSMLSPRTNLVNLRLGYVIGPKLPTKTVISRFQKMLKNNEKISLINPDTTKFSFIDLSDIAKTCEIIITKELSGNYNLVGDNACSLRELFNMIRMHFPKYNLDITESKNFDTKFSTTFSNKKIKKSGIVFKSSNKSIQEILSSDSFEYN